MANVSVYNMEGKEVGTIELNDAVFGVEVNEHLVHMAVSSFPVKAYLQAFTVSFNVTKDFFGPGTAPLTRIRLFSTSTLTISRF